MRYLTYFTPDQNRIDVFNSWLGKETIYYNGQLMSSRCTLFGSRHQFEVGDASGTAHYQVDISFKWPLRVGFDIFKNGQALLLS